MTLSGRGAVVTGGGRGIGAAVARALAGQGASVVVAARSEPEIEAVAAALRDDGAEAHALPCDVTDPDAVERLFREAGTLLGTVDILVNNAGIAKAAPVLKLDLEEWTRLWTVNATGTFLCTKAALAGMIEREWGRIVNLASVAALRGARYTAAYAASKHAVLGFTRSAAAEVADAGVTVNAVCPAYVDTPMTEGSVANVVAKTGMSEEQALQAVLASAGQRTLIAPDEVAGAVAFLCAEGARHINGQAIVIDGGALAGLGA